MKKFVKNLLFGAGIAAAGLIVYSLWKDAEEPVVVQNASVEPPATTLSKEYVERRRRQIREAAEARRAAQREVAAVSAEEKMPQDGELLHEAGEKPEESRTPLAEQNAAPVEPAPLEQAEEQQEKL